MAHNVYALISGAIVYEIVVGNYYDCDQCAKLKYGQFAYAIDVTYIPVQINDVYTEGRFYHNNVEVNPIPTEEARINELNQNLVIANSAIDDLTIAILEG